LQKKDPGAKVSEAVKPIVYYLDPGVPEPVRTALLDGARWWNEAFEAAGYRNAFRVEVLPPGADAMDVRYNVIQWVHRATRGWSYGSTVTDPRTGEIIKGHVSLGSLRVRQDYLIAEGLLAPYEAGRPFPPEMERMALARLRQLSAHEVGHTLGLSHNYIASAQRNASVMDYPHPLASLGADGTVDLSKAYATGIGEWDKAAIRYGYSDAPDERALRAILDEAHKQGLYFISDADARPPSSAHPGAHLWDNGANAADELDRIMKVRAAALARFGERNIREGLPLSVLEETLVPLYLGHRYQVEAASKSIGGLEYTYALRGDGQTVTRIVPGAEQRRAIAAVLRTIESPALTLPESVLRLIPPRPPGYPRHRETFPSRTGLTFDAVAAAEAAAGLTLSLVLDSERCARMDQYAARDKQAPSCRELMRAVMDKTWRAADAGGLGGEVQEAVRNVALYRLFELAGTAPAANVRAAALEAIDNLDSLLSMRASAHGRLARAMIRRFRENPSENPMPRPAEPPPGPAPASLEICYPGWHIRRGPK
jgi:hypothetical protein